MEVAETEPAETMRVLLTCSREIGKPKSRWIEGSLYSVRPLLKGRNAERSPPVRQSSSWSLAPWERAAFPGLEGPLCWI